MKFFCYFNEVHEILIFYRRYKVKRKVLFFLYSLSGGGAERTVINIINNIDKNKFDVLLVIGTNKNNDYINLVNKDVKIKTLDCKKLRLSLLKLRNNISKENPDILFSTINANNIILLLAKLLTFKKIPTIVREANNRTESGSVTTINRIITKFLYNKVSTKVIALSKGVKDDLVNNFQIDHNKIEVIYNPVEVEKIQESSKEEIQGFRRNKNEKLIVSVGRLVDQKDYPNLIKAFRLVNEKINSRLLILGKGPKETELKRLCEALDVKEKVQFLGFKNNPYKYMKGADVFVLSSKWEGFGHVIVEAMATGTPVISTDCNSGPKEIIKENEYGVLVSVGDPKELTEKIIELFNNQDLMDRYSIQGSKRSKDFHANNIIKQYEKVFYDMSR